MVQELEYTKHFIKAYGLFTLVMYIFQISTGMNILPNAPVLTAFSLGGIINFVGSVLSFLFGLIFYSIPQYTILNYILWIFRIISILEILIYAKRLINPVSN